MSDDRLSRDSTKEVFDAIVSQLEDPELRRVRRIFLVLGLVLFAAGTLTVTVVAGLGWTGFLAFSSTFLPGVALARRYHGRRLRP